MRDITDNYFFNLFLHDLNIFIELNNLFKD